VRDEKTSKGLTLELRVFRPQTFKSSQMVAAWPGMAFLARMSVDHLVRELDAKPFAEIHSRGNSVVVKDGVAEVSSAKSLFYSSSKLIIFSGEEQPTITEDVYRMADMVMSFAQKCNVRRVYTIAAFPATFDAPPSVFAIANNPRLLSELERLSIPLLREGFVTGLNGVLIGVAEERDIDGICLLGQVHSASVPQPRTVKAVLDLLARILEVHIDTSALEREAELMEKTIRREVERHRPQRAKGQTQRYIS